MHERKNSRILTFSILVCTWNNCTIKNPLKPTCTVRNFINFYKPVWMFIATFWKECVWYLWLWPSRVSFLMRKYNSVFYCLTLFFWRENFFKVRFKEKKMIVYIIRIYSKYFVIIYFNFFSIIYIYLFQYIFISIIYLFISIIYFKSLEPLRIIQ